MLESSCRICLQRRETQVPSLGGEDPLEEGVATRSRILAWRIPCTEEPGGLQSMGSQESDTAERQTHSHPEALKSPLPVASLFIDVAGDAPFHTAIV